VIKGKKRNGFSKAISFQYKTALENVTVGFMIAQKNL
jgi:hypothetical protein